MIDIIIPTYNCSDYIGRCLQSIFDNIMLMGFHVIVVDDCSTDDTMNIVSWYEKQYPGFVESIRLSAHSYQGAARNVGIEASYRTNSDYIMFVDADDEISPDALIRIMKSITKYEPDIIMYNVAHMTKNATTINNWQIINESKLIDISTPASRAEFFNSAVKNILIRACWDKVYKKDLVKEYDLKFATGHYDEESLFTIPAYFKANNIYLLKEVLYYYHDDHTNTIKNLNNNEEHKHDNEATWGEVYGKCRSIHVLDTDHDLFESFFYKNYYVYSLALADSRGVPYTQEEARKLFDVFKAIFPMYTKNPYIVKGGK